MKHDSAVAAVLRDYPRIYFACHRRHTREPETGELVSERQVQVLDHLDEVSPVSMTSLAAHLGVTPSTMSISIDRLAKRGFVRREHDPADGRRVLLRLTERGVRVTEAHTVLDPVLVDALLGHLSDDERLRAIDGLNLLAEGAARGSAERQRARADARRRA